MSHANPEDARSGTWLVDFSHVKKPLEEGCGSCFDSPRGWGAPAACSQFKPVAPRLVCPELTVLGR